MPLLTPIDGDGYRGNSDKGNGPQAEDLRLVLRQP